MTDCPACRDAQTRLTFIYYEGCPTCDVRRVSQQPQVRRLAYYATISDPEERAAFVLAVALEYRRDKAKFTVADYRAYDAQRQADAEETAREMEADLKRMDEEE